ncbi:hypothetical protein EV182_002914 [Spiromyces aspiralis]|uniref:Uncharacterized protein n=1 Tax=Spiromyces aspiralis TaxID=68401 RepID=A0ACC1HE54_9FUNG|nr:hypothetical protein EV182_002914 [Spiromyces aspiralis]
MAGVRPSVFTAEEARIGLASTCRIQRGFPGQVPPIHRDGSLGVSIPAMTVELQDSDSVGRHMKGPSSHLCFLQGVGDRAVCIRGKGADVRMLL